MFKKIYDAIYSLGLTQIGMFEFLFAMALMLGGYSLGSIPMGVSFWAGMMGYTFIKPGENKLLINWPILLLIAYITLRKLFIVFIDNNSNIFGILEQLIFFLSILIIYPNINSLKLKGALNLVALIAILGLLYQWSIIAAGGKVHPIELPFLTMDQGRLEGESIRPSSFFMEPAAYVAFMLCPLNLALIEHKYVWSIIIVLSIFLTTSSTGILASFIMIGIFLFSEKGNLKVKLGFSAIGAILVFSLFYFSAFSSGIEKIEKTDTSDNTRLTQGPKIMSSVDASSYIFGVPYYDAYNYYESNHVSGIVVYGGKSIFLPTFWNLLLLHGIVGVLLYVNIYWFLFKKSRFTRPLLGYLIAVLFSSGYMMGGTWVFTTIILFTLANQDKNLIVDARI